MYIVNNNKEVLAPFKSGAKILTGTKTVLTNQARETLHNVQSTISNIKKQTDPKDTITFNDVTIDDNGFHTHENVMKINNTNRERIKNKATMVLKESMYKPLTQMGSSTMVHNVANPYNPKRKSKSIVDQKHRFATKKDIYPKMKVDNTIMDKRVRHVRTYLYKDANGMPVAAKLEHQPKQPIVVPQ